MLSMRNFAAGLIRRNRVVIVALVQISVELGLGTWQANRRLLVLRQKTMVKVKVGISRWRTCR
jgi:hypothetical protein